MELTMRDSGLKLAIDAAGGVGALARGLGIRQPSVSSWTRVPAERVLAAESLTGVTRELIRPDLYAPEQTQPLAAEPAIEDVAAIDPVELARASHYLLLARLLRTAPRAAFLADIAALGGDGSPLGLARIALADAAARTSEADAGNEFFSLFIGVGRGEILPYASFYLTGFLHERPLAQLRQDLTRLGIERSAGNFDPEDHLGVLLEIMGGFASGVFPGNLATQKDFFARHLAPWSQRAFNDIANAPSAKLYAAVGRFGRHVMAIETEAFEFDEPVSERRERVDI